jgi:hypothetical protein
VAETKAILIVARDTDHAPDWPDGFMIAGAIDYGISDVIDQGEFDEMVAKIKSSFEPEPNFYDWQQIIISIPDDEFAKLFPPKDVEITPTVEGLDPGYEQKGNDDSSQH